MSPTHAKSQPALLRAAAALGLWGLVQGCAVGPDYTQPEPALPDAWHQQLMRGLSQRDANLQTWWATLDDPMLTSLIERSESGNLDLAQAILRVDGARAQRGIARGEWFPSTDAQGSYQRARTSKRIASDIPPPQSRTDNFWSTGLDASWEVDFFGRIRRNVESSTASLEQSVEDYRDALVTLFADVALNYVEVRTLQERIRYTESNIENQRNTMQLVVDRNRAGLVGDLDVRQAEQNLASTESFLPALRQSLYQNMNRLGVLLGMPPSALHAELVPDAPIPRPPDEVLIGLPANLIRQRPDIRSAERQLAAQSAQIGVATADLYPRFSLLGTFAFESTDAAAWITGDGGSYSFGPSVTWNIFDGGRIRSNIEFQEFLTDEFYKNYENTVLRALEDVENSMIAYVEEQQRLDALRRSATAAAAAVALVTTLYRTGLTDFQNVLDTERTLFEEQDSVAASQGLVTQNLIGVYRALGGGWSP